MNNTMSTREFMELLHLAKAEFYDLKAATGDQFPQPLGRGRTGYSFNAKDCRRFAAAYLAWKAEELQKKADVQQAKYEALREQAAEAKRWAADAANVG